MNTHAEYRRLSPRPPEQPAGGPERDDVVSQFARHRDPSLPAGTTASAAGTTTSATTRNGVDWVRPTDLPTYAGPIVGRGIDLQSELIRRARRSPATSTRALSLGLPRVAAPTPTINRQEGLQL